MFGIECVFGGLSWERSVFDPVPGPRTFEETKNARKLNDVVWYANKDTVTHTGVRFAEAGFSDHRPRDDRQPLTEPLAGGQGHALHLGLSTHRNAEKVLLAVIETGWYNLAMITITPGGATSPE